MRPSATWNRVLPGDDPLEDGYYLQLECSVVPGRARAAMRVGCVAEDVVSVASAHDLQVAESEQQRLADGECGNAGRGSIRVCRIGHGMLLAWLGMLGIALLMPGGFHNMRTVMGLVKPSLRFATTFRLMLPLWTAGTVGFTISRV